MSADYLVRAGRAGIHDMRARTPELAPLAEKSIAVFGLGCIGAPSAFEFIRAGIGKLSVVDHDIVDPATIARWPLGLSAAGLKKVRIVSDYAQRNYPWVDVRAFDHRVGMVRAGRPGEPSEQELFASVTEGVDLIYDATADLGPQHFLADLARENGVPYVGVWGTAGGWGGEILRLLPGRAECCWACFQRGREAGLLPHPEENRTAWIQPIGCADPTFTAAGFDMAQIATLGVRAAVATLCAGADGAYPPMAWDLTSVELRDADGNLLPPRVRTARLSPYPECRLCGGDWR